MSPTVTRRQFSFEFFLVGGLINRPISLKLTSYPEFKLLCSFEMLEISNDLFAFKLHAFSRVFVFPAHVFVSSRVQANSSRILRFNGIDPSLGLWSCIDIFLSTSETDAFIELLSRQLFLRNGLVVFDKYFCWFAASSNEIENAPLSCCLT